MTKTSELLRARYAIAFEESGLSPLDSGSPVLDSVRTSLSWSGGAYGNTLQLLAVQ